MSSKTAKQLREVYGRRIDGTVGLIHRDVLIDASDLSALLDMAEEAEEVRSVKVENEKLKAEIVTMFVTMKQEEP